MILHIYNHPEAKTRECDCHHFGGSVLGSPTLYPGYCLGQKKQDPEFLDS